MAPRNLSNSKERSSGANLFLRLAHSASVEDVLEDFAKIAEEKGIRLYSLRFKRGRLDGELKPPNAGSVIGKINELAVDVEGGQTHLVVRFYEPTDGAVMGELEYAANLAAHRMEVLAGGCGRPHPGKSEEEEVDGRSRVTGELIGESELMREVRENIVIAARLNLSVLIIGEPGTGKELVARGIHKSSSRGGKPFVDVNCAAINPNLIESELFGHEKGAFTGALARKPGRFERASGGTLFLDEIGDLPQQSQAMLLRVLQERTLERVGGTEAIKIDIRLIAATNHDLLREVDEGRFRRDLYDRLCGYPIRTPALRERPTDIPILVRRYFPSIEFENDALGLLCHYTWPGNVRQLMLTVERLAAKAGSGRVITADYVRREIDFERKPVFAPNSTDCLLMLREGETLKEYLCRIILAAYEDERARLGSHSAAANRLGLHRNTLYDWLEWARRHAAKSTATPKC
jgi:transcriptional regulator with PAS, ATPase and Fis domain